MVENKPRNNATLIRRLVFDLLFINTFSITMIYYDFPFLASIIPSNMFAAFPVIVAVILMVIRFIKNPRIRINVAIYLLIIALYILFSLMGNELIARFVNGSSFIVYTVVCLFLLLEDDIECLTKHLIIDTYVVGIVYIAACVFYSAGRLYSDNSAVSYMTLGYGMTLPTMLCYEFYRKEKHKTHLIMALILSMLTLMFGNRGALIMISLYVIVWAIQSIGKNSNKKTILLILIGSMFVVFVFFGGMNYVTNLIASIIGKAGFDSRNILKLISGSVWIDRDRTLIRGKAYEMIAANPFAIRGPGALTREYISQDLIGANAHNMFLELWVEYGILFGSVISIYLYKKIISASKLKSYIVKDNCGILAFTTLMQALIMLFFSGTLYSCSALWIGLAMISACKARERVYS